jgi:hypothetical protein
MAQQKGAKRAVKVAARKRKLDDRKREANAKRLARVAEHGHEHHDHEHDHERERETAK